MGDEPTGRPVYRGTQDDEQAEWLADEFAQGVRYDHTSKQWHVWNGVRWAPDKTGEVERRTMDAARDRLYAEARGDGQKRIMDLYRKLLDVGPTRRALEALSTRPGYGTDGADWDQDPILIGCENGIVDLTKNALVPATPSMLVTKTTKHTFEPFHPKSDLLAEFSARAPRFWRFLLEVTSNDVELALFYLQWFGYSLFGHTREQRFLILTGLGRNGKGALVTAMREVFGEYSANADANIYMRTRFGAARSDGARADLMELKGRRLAVMSEPDGGAFNEEMLKAHTGGDPITARALYSNNVISWVPTHTITFLTNNPPSVSDIGPAMAARVMVADFRERFEGDREDKRLYGVLKGEADGILSILVWAAWWWNQQPNGLVLPERVLNASAEYLAANDPLGNFITEAMRVERGLQCSGKAAYDAYLDWYERSGRDGEPMSQTKFGIELSKRGFPKGHNRFGVTYLNIAPLSAIALAEAEDEDA